MRILVAIFAARQFDDCCEHVEKWNELENNPGIDQLLIGALSRLINLASQQNRRRDCSLHQNRNPRSLPARMNLAECRGKITVDSDNKGHPGNRSEEHTSELQSRQYLVCR